MMVVNESTVLEHRPNGYKVAARSKSELRSIGDGSRSLLKKVGCYRTEYYLDVKHLLEDTLHTAGFYFHPEEDEKLPGVAAYTNPIEKCIVLRNSIYDGLFVDDPFSRFTIVHEFSHIVLDHGTTFHRNTIRGKHKWYEDSEWQANNLAAEIMMPIQVIQHFKQDIRSIMKACGVSSQAVQYRLNNLRKEGVL